MIFGIGLPKTGTTSLYAALNYLGFEVITWRHMRELGLAAWRQGDFSPDYLDGFDGATDLPVGTYFRELDARYPGSRFILTERPLDGWLTSLGAQFRAAPNPGDPFRRDIRMATFGVSTFHEGRFRRAYQDHAAGVRAHFAARPEALLIQSYFAGDGWETLCAFLDRPVPDVPFPNVKPGHKAVPGKLTW
jgi:Sulfotransferase domain